MLEHSRISKHLDQKSICTKRPLTRYTLRPTQDHFMLSRIELNFDLWKTTYKYPLLPNVENYLGHSSSSALEISRDKSISSCFCREVKVSANAPLLKYSFKNTAMNCKKGAKDFKGLQRTFPSRTSNQTFIIRVRCYADTSLAVSIRENQDSYFCRSFWHFKHLKKHIRKIYTFSPSPKNPYNTLSF